MVAQNEISILGRLVSGSLTQLDTAQATAILSLKFADSDLDRMKLLAEQNAAGLLSDDEQDELAAYANLGDLLALMKANARLALRDSVNR